jgi:hypothetical protein
MIRNPRRVARTPFAIALALVALLAAPLGAQGRVTAETRLAARLDAGTRQAVVAIVDSAQRRRVPVEPLVDKALEGASKRAQPEQIVRAVRALATSLERSRAILGPDASEADVVAGASALRQGVSPELLRRLRDQRQRREITVALGVLTELAARGAPADSVARALMALTGAGASDAVLAEFGRDVESDIASGIASPVNAVTSRTESFLIGQADNGVGRSSAPREPRRKP